jgi:hypothetical protein
MAKVILKQHFLQSSTKHHKQADWYVIMISPTQSNHGLQIYTLLHHQSDSFPANMARIMLRAQMKSMALWQD